MIKNFKKRYSGDYGIKLTPRKLWTFCGIDWTSFRVSWLSEGSPDKELVCKVFRVEPDIAGMYMCVIKKSKNGSSLVA